MRLDGLEQLNCSQSMKSVLNFNPEDVITNKKNTYRTRKSGASSGTILKTQGGFEAIGKRPLQYLANVGKRTKNKRQFSEDQMLKMSQEMMKIMHRHHLSTGDTKFTGLNISQMKRLENACDEDVIKEMSNFMEPREIISIFSMERRGSPMAFHHNNQRENAINSVQLSTLSTNPKHKGEMRKQKYDEDSENIEQEEGLKVEEREALIEDNSMMYDEVMNDDEAGGAGPNEAMYINVDPIPKSLMLTFEEAIQRQKEILDKSSKVNEYCMPIWDSRKHTKHKFYKGDDIEKNDSANIFE